ncbi:MAG: hypothetical protein DI587_13715 [Variovorax paradoxus]|nr:MAG: hypothetical protein DI583_13715 [Variovorax paradoxus]PZQ10125.1 MAG: hypothetical protein DI587_13715 [Variovorax paradoxus]
MSHLGISIRHCGMVTSLGATAASTCAAVRAKLSNASTTQFAQADGEWLVAHQVALGEPAEGVHKLALMAAMAIGECLDGISPSRWSSIPMLLCLADSARPGRVADLEDRLLRALERMLGTRFGKQSAVLAHGRVGASVALAQAQRLIAEGVPQVLIVATDSLLEWSTLDAYMAQGRLLGPFNANGFVAGEGAGAVLVTAAGPSSDMVCLGVGFGHEPAHIDSGEPLRGDGLAQAIKAALAPSGLQIHEVDYRVADLSGEQYYFKEAALALLRTMRHRRETFDLWHPAECIGELGAVAGMAGVILATHAGHRNYAPGGKVLIHCANDGGQRAALVLQKGAAS